MSNEFSFDLGAMGPMLDAMMSRYGQYMDLGLEQAREEAPRKRVAFDLYQKGKRSELKDAELRRKQAKKAEGTARRLEAKADQERKRKEAMDYAEQQRARQALWNKPENTRGMVGGTRPSAAMSMDPATRQLMQSVATGTLRR